MVELVDMRDLGDVTSVKIFRVGFDQQLLVQGFPYGKAIYAQIQIRDFALLKFFFFILNKIATGDPAAHICGHDGIGRHARFR